MPYGQGQALGATIDPRMFVQDYSGFSNAAAIQAAGMMNFGNQIGGAISDYAKESKALKGEIAKGKSALAFAKAYHPELADKIDQLGQIFQDPTKSVVEQAAAGSQMGDFVAAILGGEQFKKEMSLKERETKIREAAMIGELNAPQPSPLGDPIAIPDGKGGTVMMQRNKMTGALVPAQFDGDPTLQDLPALDGNGNPIEQAADMWGANGMVLPDKGAIGAGIEQAARLGYKPPEGGAGTVMSDQELADTIKKGYEVDAEPIGNNQYRVKGIKGSPVAQQDKGVIMTKEQVEELKQSGNDFTAEPVEGDKYRVTQVRGSNTNYDKMRGDVATARKLYEEGKTKEALDLMVAMKFSSPFGAAVDMNTLELLWGPPGVPKGPDAPPAPTVPLSERLKQLDK